MEVQRIKILQIVAVITLMAATVTEANFLPNNSLPPFFNPDVSYFEENPGAILNYFGFMNLAVKQDNNSASCGDSSGRTETNWHSPGYPKITKLPSVCTLNLMPPDNTCAYRITFKDVVFTPKIDLTDFVCPDDVPSFQMSHSDGISTPLCTDLTDVEGIMEVDPEDPGPFVLLLNNAHEKDFKFQITATAIPCNGIKTYRSPNICGIKNEGLISKFLKELASAPITSPDEGDAVSPIEGSPIPSTVNPTVSPLILDLQDTKGEEQKQSPAFTKESLLKGFQKKDDIYSKGLVSGLRKDVLQINNNVKPRVLGSPTTLNELPWMAVILKTVQKAPSDEADDPISGLLVNPLSSNNCTGVLVDEEHVLTSAACILSYTDGSAVPVRGLRVVLGEHNLTTTKESETLTIHVSKVTFPLTYKPFTFRDDLAVLKLAEPVEFNDRIRPICLPVEYNHFKDLVGIVSGWGGGGLFFPPPTGLVWMPVFLFDRDVCNATVYQMLSLINNIHPSFDASDVDLDDYICAGLGLLSPVCLRDYGTPLIRRDRTGAFYLVGMSASINTCFFLTNNIFSAIKPNSTFLNLALL